MGRIGQVADINSLSSSQIETQYHCSLYAEYVVYAKGTNSQGAKKKTDMPFPLLAPHDCGFIQMIILIDGHLCSLIDISSLVVDVNNVF